MSTPPRRDPQEVLRDGAALDRAMVAARRRAILHHRRLGVPLAVWQDGKVVDLDPDSVPLPEYEEEVASPEDEDLP